LQLGIRVVATLVLLALQTHYGTLMLAAFL